MAISRVWIEDGCIACGNCESVCPEVFIVSDHSDVKDGVIVADFEAGIRQAAEECPVEVIKFE